MMTMRRWHVCHLLVSIYIVSLLEGPHVMAWSRFQRVYRALRSQAQRNTVTFPSDTNVTFIHEYFMDMALQQAHNAHRIGEVPIGAIVVRPVPHNPGTFRVLSRASNQVETTHDASAHAELLAMRKAASRIENWRLLNTTLYSTLEPCPMCLAACQSFRVNEIVYAAPDLRLGAIETHMQLLEVPHPFHNITSVVKGIHDNQSVELIQSFFRRRRQESKQQNNKQRRNKVK